MNVERVVSIISGSDEDSDWNLSEEEDRFDESLRVDQLSMEQHGKMVDRKFQYRFFLL